MTRYAWQTTRRLARSREMRQPARTASTIVRAIMERLDASGLTYPQFVRRLGVSETTVSNWRHGRTMPNLMQVEAMAEILDLQLSIIAMDKPNDMDEA